MWRVGVLVVLSVVFISEAAEYKYGTQLRIRRSPHYDCPPFYPPPPPRFWPPPPRHHHFGPPPYWPPPPPPPQDQPNQLQPSSQSQAESSAGSDKSGALTQLPSGQDGGSRQGRGPGLDGGPGQGRGPGLDRSPGQDRGQGQDRRQDEGGPGNQPCDTCSGNGQQNSAVSNAKSETGSAIAIAISGRNGNN